MTGPKAPVKTQSAFERMLAAPILDAKAEKAFKEMKADMRKHPEKSRSTDGFSAGGASLGLVQTGKGGGGRKEKTVGHHGITKAQFHAQVRQGLRAGVEKARTLRLPSPGKSFLVGLASGQSHLVKGKGVQAMREAAQGYIYNQVSYRPLKGQEVTYRYHNNDRVWGRMAQAHAEKQRAAAEKAKKERQAFADSVLGKPKKGEHTIGSYAAARRADRMLDSLPKDSAPIDIVDRELKRQSSAPTQQAHAKNDQIPRSHPAVGRSHVKRESAG